MRVGSLFEWMVAGSAVLALVWLLSVPVQRLLGPQVEAALVDMPTIPPPGVPVGATLVPVLLLLDGGEVRQGDLHSRLSAVLPDSRLASPIHRSQGEFGERHTRSYMVNGSRVYVVCERAARGAPMRVAGIYFP